MVWAGIRRHPPASPDRRQGQEVFEHDPGMDGRPSSRSLQGRHEPDTDERQSPVSLLLPLARLSTAVASVDPEFTAVPLLFAPGSLSQLAQPMTPSEMARMQCLAK
jgi:hypothetical protein